MIQNRTFAYRFFPFGSGFRRTFIGLFGLIFLWGATALGQRLGVEQPNNPRPNQPQGRLGITQPSSSRLGLAVERSQRLGVQQVGEATAEATRQLAARPVVSGPEAKVDQADRLVEQGQLENAVALYRKVIDMQPQMVSAHMGLGYALIKMGDFDAAVGEYQKAVAQAPNNSEAQLNLGVALYRGGRIAEAIEQYKHALVERKEHFPAAHFNLAMAYAHEGDFNQAIEHYRAAIEQRGKSYSEAYNNLGLIYEAMGNVQTAAEQFRLAIEEQRGRYPLAHYNLARFYQGQGKYSEAIAEFQLAIKQQPNFPESYLDLGNLYLIRTSVKGTNELDQAIASYRKAIELREDFYPLAHENLAIALTKKKDKKGALDEYRVAFDQNEGQSAETLQNLIATLSEGDSFIIGNELSRSDNAGNLTSKKSVVKSGERLVAALNRYEELDEELKNLAQVRYCAGLAFAAVGNWNSAANELARAVELSGKKDQEAARALVSVLELVRYF